MPPSSRRRCTTPAEMAIRCLILCSVRIAMITTRCARTCSTCFRDVLLLTGAEGKYGFVELRSVAEATSCMALNNIELGGKQLRVERTRDYGPMPEAMLDEVCHPQPRTFPRAIANLYTLLTSSACRVLHSFGLLAS